MKRKVLYCRCSSLDQKPDRQKVNEKDFDIIIEDRISGSIPFFKRPGGEEIRKLVDHQIIGTLYCWSIDRLGRSLIDILQTINYFSERDVTIYFQSQGLRTRDENGKVNGVAQMVISVLGCISEIERTQIRERQFEGIHLAKLKGNVYKGRKPGSKEDVLKFLGKEKNRKALDYLKKGYKSIEIAKLLDLNVNTITKIKKLGLKTISS